MKHKKLAYVSPLPPQKSGISYYSQELLKQLSSYYDIDVILSDDLLEETPKNKNYQIKSAAYFKMHHVLYERVIYHFGNSPFHAYMLDLLEQISGVVVLHDFYLSDLVNYAQTLDKNLFYLLHGYKAAKDSDSLINLMSKFPTNMYVLNEALGVIVHSEYSKTLAKKYYFKPNLDTWHTIPHLRESPHKEHLLSREDLDIPKDAFIACSFGILGANKLNEKLLDAWINSSLFTDANCYLLFVGENDTSEYGQRLQKKIDMQKNINITGWSDTKTFESYLSLTDIAVQLRTNSRGETSGTVLDAMNYAIPTIVNANGSIAELPQNALYMLKDDFKTEELTEALEKLYKDKSLRERLSKNAVQHIKIYHDPASCAKHYFQAIESSYDQTKNYKYKAIKELSQTIQEIPKLVKTLSLSNFDSLSQRQILVDVSYIVKQDLKTGIQRVVRSQLIELINNAPDNYKIEPVYLSDKDATFFYARSYTAKLLKLNGFDKKDEPLHVNIGDIFYGLDLYPEEVSKSKEFGIYDNYKSLGIKFYFVVYDLLPITNPEFFPPNAKQTHTQWLEDISDVADTLICISNTVAQEVISWLDENKKTKALEITSIHLGADILQNVPDIVRTTKEKPTFLMVGTIEPRKGHAQTLEAFEQLWSEDIEVNLSIVGKKGWMVDDFTQKLSTHPELNKHLFYHEHINDEELSKLYASSDALIAASEAEGFGLPLIEAAQYDLPIIARDIPVFREVASTYAYYFEDTKDAKTLALSIKSWLKLYRKETHPRSTEMPYISWKENAQKVLKELR